MATKTYPFSNISSSPSEVLALIREFKAPPKFPTSFSLDGKDFLKNIFKNEPEKRMTASQLLAHPWLIHNDNEVPAPIKDQTNSPVRFGEIKDHRFSQIKIVSKDSAKNQPNQIKYVNILKENKEDSGNFSVSISFSVDESSMILNQIDSRIKESQPQIAPASPYMSNQNLIQFQKQSTQSSNPDTNNLAKLNKQPAAKVENNFFDKAKRNSIDAPSNQNPQKLVLVENEESPFEIEDLEGPCSKEHISKGLKKGGSVIGQTLDLREDYMKMICDSNNIFSLDADRDKYNELLKIK